MIKVDIPDSITVIDDPYLKQTDEEDLHTFEEFLERMKEFITDDTGIMDIDIVENE